MGENIRYTPGVAAASSSAERHQYPHDLAGRVAAEYQLRGGGGGSGAAVEPLHNEFFREPDPRGVRGMKLAIVGYGKMGRLIEQLAPEYGFEVGSKLDEFNNANFEGHHGGELSQGSMSAIDFSMPAAGCENIERIAALGVNMVVGTTGWLEASGRSRAAVEANNIGLVWSPNFSIGVNVFFRLVAEAARLLADQPEYGAWAWEIHHDTKKDAPSGTLLKLVDEMKKAGYTRTIDVSSNRAGRIPGRTRSASIRRPTRSRCGTRRAAAKGLRGGAEGGAMDQRQKGILRIQRNCCFEA